MKTQFFDIGCMRDSTELDKAFEWLDIAFEQKDSYMTQLIFNPWLAPLHDDPRWEVILDKMGLLEYWKELQV